MGQHMGHVRKDIIERYSLGRLNESGVKRVEEHLLLCETCRCSLDHFEAFLSLLRSTVIKSPAVAPAHMAMSAG